MKKPTSLQFSSYRRGWLDAASGRDADVRKLAADADYAEGWRDGTSARNDALDAARKRFGVTTR